MPGNKKMLMDMNIDLKEFVDEHEPVLLTGITDYVSESLENSCKYILTSKKIIFAVDNAMWFCVLNTVCRVAFSEFTYKNQGICSIKVYFSDKEKQALYWHMDNYNEAKAFMMFLSKLCNFS